MTTEKIVGAGKVTIELDLTAFVGNVFQDESGEYHDGTSAVREQLIERAAWMIREDVIEDVRKEARKASAPVIEAYVAEIVSATLEGEFRPVNGYGEPSRKATTLREQIGKEASEWLTKKADRYGSGPNNLEAVVKKVVDQQLARDFTKIIADEKAKIVVQLRNAAAEMLAKEAAKR